MAVHLLILLVSARDFRHFQQVVLRLLDCLVGLDRLQSLLELLLGPLGFKFEFLDQRVVISHLVVGLELVLFHWLLVVEVYVV